MTLQEAKLCHDKLLLNFDKVVINNNKPTGLFISALDQQTASKFFERAKQLNNIERAAIEMNVTEFAVYANFSKNRNAIVWEQIDCNQNYLD